MHDSMGTKRTHMQVCVAVTECDKQTRIAHGDDRNCAQALKSLVFDANETNDD